jgi:hypothetical protein
MDRRAWLVVRRHPPKLQPLEKPHETNVPVDVDGRGCVRGRVHRAARCSPVRQTRGCDQVPQGRDEHDGHPLRARGRHGRRQDPVRRQGRRGQRRDRGFIEGTDKGDTKAKPEIWSESDKFKAAAAKMQEEMAKLNVAAKAGNLDAIKVAVGETGKQCKGCHDTYRKE